MAKNRNKNPRPKPRSAPAAAQSQPIRGGQHTPPPSKQLPEEEVPNTPQDTPDWWPRIRPSDRGAVPKIPDTDDDYDETKHDFPMWWASIRLDTFVRLAQAAHPAMWIVINVLAEGGWRTFLQGLPEVRRRLERKDWSQVPGRALVAYVEGMTGIRMGIRKFLPSKYADVPFAERSVLYLRALILWGTIRGGRFPLQPAYEAVRLYEGGPYAIREILRRGATHVGGHMALLLMNPEDGPTAAKALEGLRKLMYGHLPSATRDRIGRNNYTGRTNRHIALRAEMDRQAFETGKKHWGHHGLRGLVLRWLASKLNIAPLAIANDLQDADRNILGRLRRENLFTEDDIFNEDEDQDASGWEAAQAQEVKDKFLALSKFSLKDVLDNVEVKAVLERFLAPHPKHQRGIEAFLSDDLRDFAKQHSVTVKTVIDWKNRAVTAFEKWHKRGGPHPRDTRKRPGSEERPFKGAISIRPDIHARVREIVEKVERAEAKAVTPRSPSAS